jgi:plastocyanin
MNKISKILIAIIGVLVVAGGIWAITSMTNKPTDTDTSDQSTPSDSQTNQSTSNQTDQDASVAVVITYGDNGFEPATATVKSGSKIQVVNNSQDELELASDPHPTHTINPELNTEDIEPGSSKTITVTTTGEWGYHNHYNPSKRGTLTVESAL